MSSNYSSRGRPTGSSYRGRGSHSSYSSKQPSYPPLPPDRVLTEGLTRIAICTLNKPSASSTPGVTIKPENLKYIGSYNWVDELSPTIIVPGSPPEWRKRPFPYRVPYDTGPRMVDQNGHRMGSASTLLPLLRAVDVVAEADADTSFDWSSIDVVTDRNGLRKLLRWLHYDPSSSSDPPKDFRIDIQLGGNKTLLFHRWEKRKRELAEPPRSGCGINFERESTTPAPGCSRGTGHHRIVQYDLGGLKVVVRFEVDACVAGTANNSAPKSPTLASPTPKRATGNVDDLADLLSGLDVQSAAGTGSSSTSAGITVIPGGSKVPQSAIIELTTRSINTVEDFDWQEQFPQLFLSGTPNLYLAVHQRGTFERAIEHRVGSEEMHSVEQGTRTQRGFRQLVAVLRQLQTMAREHGKRVKLSLVCQEGVLKVYERGGEGGVLEDADLERFGV
ncbi:uncharacterized protein BXZ73DRAFT_46733 [Epithele typhae]|uniref:uncharacterized protein n=1 Tax=Epithele typhae TaxID=378194 RepID=UPI002007B626|nr:uncharacterized protein BXZ73DRAFT_46733 [Epithele typhae]KAH9932793.1 hypothetical protein BXZ73DRAFT_46733 [Epithele typhae]